MGWDLLSSPLCSDPPRRPNVVYVASNHFVWRLVPVSISSQIRQLLQDKQFELALQLAVSATCRLRLTLIRRRVPQCDDFFFSLFLPEDEGRLGR